MKGRRVGIISDEDSYSIASCHHTHWALELSTLIPDGLWLHHTCLKIDILSQFLCDLWLLISGKQASLLGSPVLSAFNPAPCSHWWAFILLYWYHAWLKFLIFSDLFEAFFCGLFYNLLVWCFLDPRWCVSIIQFCYKSITLFTGGMCLLAHSYQLQYAIIASL